MEIYRHGTCVQCVVQQELRQRFVDGDGTSPPACEALIQALERSRRPRSVLKWLGNPRGGAATLADLIQLGEPISHETLDRHPAQQTWSLRRSLVELEALPARNEPLAHVKQALQRIIADTTATADSQILATYGAWSVERRSRANHERTGRFTVAASRAAQTRLTSAAHLLTWLRSEGIELAAANQSDLDRWAEQAGSDRATIADFLSWSARRGLSRKLRVVRKPRKEPPMLFSETERCNRLRRCLQDDDLPDDLRAAGALVPLYGLQLTRIIELTRAQLHAEPASSEHPQEDQLHSISLPPQSIRVPVPSSLATILHRLPTLHPNPRGQPLIRGEAAHDWLFPGRGGAGHVHASVMSKRLRDLAIPVQQARNAALMAAASDLPPAVLSQALGLSITAALQWSRRAARDYNGYIAARSQINHPDQRSNALTPPG